MSHNIYTLIVLLPQTTRFGSVRRVGDFELGFEVGIIQIGHRSVYRGYLGARHEKVGIPGEATSFIKNRSAR